MNRQEFLELSAGHALHALSADDEQLFTEAIAAHPEWADDAGADLETSALLGGAVASVAPPAELRAKIFDQIGG
ncbi:MAG TPA: anti-sigma factor, partial [Diaminobutyricibacter sp.]